MNKKRNSRVGGVTFFLLLLMIVGVFWMTNQAQNRERQISYKEFKQQVEDGNVSAAIVRQNKAIPTGTVEIQLKDTSEIKIVTVSDVKQVEEVLNEKDIVYEVMPVPQDSWLTTTLLPMLLTVALVFILFMFMNRQGPEQMQRL